MRPIVPIVLLPSLIAWNLLAGVAAAAVSPATRPADPAARAYSEALERLGGDDVRLVWETGTHDMSAVHLGKSKITPPIAALLARHEQTLELIRRGAREPRCEWSQLRAPPIARALMNATTQEATTTTRPATTRAAAADDDDGDEAAAADDPEVNTAMSGATLTILAALRAQQLFEQGQPGEAAMWLGDALAVTRQMTAAADWGMFHIGMLFERAVIAAITERLLDVPRPQLEQLKARLASLPPPRRFRDLMAERTKKANQASEQLRAEAVATEAEVAAADPALAAAATRTTTSITKTLDDRLAGDRAVVEAMSVPPDDALDRLEAALKPLDEQDKDLWRSTVKASLPLRMVEAPLEAQRPMLLAAIDVALHGPDALATIKDPFAAGAGAPFEYRRMGDGFQLISQLTVNRKPVSLEVGDVRAAAAR